MKQTGRIISKRFKPHELAPHVAAMFRMLPHDDMRPVETAMRHAIELLHTVEPSELDLTNPDNGISYALMVEGGEYKENFKAAGSLLRMCLHAAERGATTENDRVFIPMQLAALADFVPDFQSRNSGKNRPSRSEPDALDRGLDDALNENPNGNWKELATWLEGEGVVTMWGDGEPVKFTDGEASKTVSHKTFVGRITKAKKRIAKLKDRQ